MSAMMNMFDRIYNYFILKKNHVQYETYPRIWGRLMIKKSPEGEILFKKNCRIRSSLWNNPVGGTGRSVLLLAGKGKIIVGNHSGFSNTVLAAQTKIEIGDHVFIGAGCKIYDTDFHSIYHEERIDGNKGVKSKPVVIEDQVFIGACSIILKGVTIGKESVVGAGSVVSKSIPPGEIWAGNPARFIRKLRPLST